MGGLFRREAGRDRPASWTAVHFEDNGINGPIWAGLRCFGGIWLICVVVHFTSATQAFHLVLQIYSSYRYALPAIAQGFGHPNKFGQELIDSAEIGIVQQLAARVEGLLDTREIYVPKYRYETQFPHHWQQIFNDASSTEWSSRHSDDSNGFMYVLLEAAV